MGSRFSSAVPVVPTALTGVVHQPVMSTPAHYLRPAVPMASVPVRQRAASLSYIQPMYSSLDGYGEHAIPYLPAAPIVEMPVRQRIPSMSYVNSIHPNIDMTTGFAPVVHQQTPMYNYEAEPVFLDPTTSAYVGSQYTPSYYW